jgi:hypothetical protein
MSEWSRQWLDRTTYVTLNVFKKLERFDSDFEVRGSQN